MSEAWLSPRPRAVVDQIDRRRAAHTRVTGTIGRNRLGQCFDHLAVVRPVASKEPEGHDSIERSEGGGLGFMFGHQATRSMHRVHASPLTDDVNAPK